MNFTTPYIIQDAHFSEFVMCKRDVVSGAAMFFTLLTTISLTILKVGTGEYTTGFVSGGMSGSDKKVGVVGLTLFDLRRRGKVGKLSMVGTSGSKFPAIRMSVLIAVTVTSKLMYRRASSEKYLSRL